MNQKFSEGLIEDRVSLLMSLLRTINTDQVCSYHEILVTIEKSTLDRQARLILARARHRMMKDENVLFDTVRKIGLRRLSDEEIVKLGSWGIKQIRRSAQRTTQKIIVANYDKLSTEGQVLHNTYLSMLGTLNAIAQPSKIAAVKNEVQKIQSQLSIGNTLEALK